jgi:hypothetical protein
MDDLRYNIVPSDDKARGTVMIIRERIRDYDNRAVKDPDFEPEYYVVINYANKRLDELNESLLNG